jgi:hypothetical protein
MRKRPKIIAVDFDGTIVKDKWPDIGKPKRHIIEKIRKEKKRGSIIILNTCRTGKELEKAIIFCKENNIPIDYANRDADWVIKEFTEHGNIDRLIKENGTDRRYIKIYADEYWDDKAINVKDV